MTGRPPRNTLDLAEKAADLWQKNGDPDISYSTRIFAQTSLPYKRPKQDDFWVRKNGDLVLTLQSGTTVDNGETRHIGLPFGGTPRLVLNYLCHQAVLTGEPKIFLGNSMSAFMKSLGQAPTGGRNGTITRLREQTMRLFKSNVTVDWYGDPDVDIGGQFRIAKMWELSWWGADRTGQPTLDRSCVTLSLDFLKEIKEHPVPVDNRILAELSDSPMRMDQYTWLTYRFSTLQRPLLVRWEPLRAQFGSDLADSKQGTYQFKRDFTNNLAVVKAFYPQANVEIVDEGVWLRPSRTSVPLKGLKFPAQVQPENSEDPAAAPAGRS